MRKIFIGTSGWDYPHWKGVFYPVGLAQDKQLDYYAKFFNAVELNITFYRLLPVRTFENWNKNTTKKFSFTVKGPRFITHVKKLSDIEEPLDLFLNSSLGLKEKLSAMLWQFPPNLKRNLKRLERLLELLKKSGKRQVFEFRNPTWFCRDLYDLLKEYNACLCIGYSKSWPCIEEVTTDFLYLRFHGNGSPYNSSYSDSELKKIADFVNRFKDKDIYAFFNNDACGYAVKDAARFKDFLGA